MTTFAAITLAEVTAFVAVVYLLRHWVAYLDGRLFMDDITPVAADVSANEPTAVARFGYDTDSKEAAA